MCHSEVAMDHLVDHLLNAYNIRNDAALAKALGLHAPTISKLRNGRMSLTPSFMIRVHETFGTPIAEIKRIAYGK